MTEPAAWARAFALTVAIEAPIVMLWFRSVEPSRPRRVVAAFFASLATHPIVWFVFPALRRAVGVGHAPSVAASELFAVAVEALFYGLVFRTAAGRVRAARALAGSAVANGASLGVGLALRHLGGWV